MLNTDRIIILIISVSHALQSKINTLVIKNQLVANEEYET